ncbi:MAG: DNA internalization-related competence protein ComEC/Rec2 [Legionella sp.]|nr:MAG: DNA internalization-related competence protein ComEC/Rec2 [Legionella sp.]
MEIICFFLGITYGLTHHGGLILACFALIFINLRYASLLFFISGSLLAYGHRYYIEPTGIPNQPVIPQALIAGKISSIPTKDPNKTQFTFAISRFNAQPARAMVQLSWYNPKVELHANEDWQFLVKLKKPRNFANPGGYPYEHVLAARHIHWTGYITSNRAQLLRSPTTQNILGLREQFARYLKTLSPNSRVTGILEALTLNLSMHITQEDWELFRRTGTTHLFGISGEHITLISGLIFALVKWLWSRSALLCLRIPAFYPASIAGLGTAFVYSLIAGFAPPVQRALIGCFFYTLYCLGKQRLSPWQIWRYALFGVLCFEPHAVFMQGFYFSFLAVACLLLTQQRWQLRGFKASLALQFCCLLGLMPLSLYWYSYASLNGFVANAFAIPLVGLFIVPLALLLFLVPVALGQLLIQPLTMLIQLLFQGLTLSEKIAFINIQHPITSWTLVIAFLGACLLWILLPGKSFRPISILWLCLLFFPPRISIAPETALIRILDVGQGLAVSIQTRHHVLLYDTGDQFFKGNDLGNMVILPFYTQMGVKKIDKLVISHPDKDHRGGLKSIEKALPVQQLLVNDRRYYHHGFKCHEQSPWQWDGVYFRFLPIKKRFQGKNNSSCILQISTKNYSMLLPGDIEQAAEDYLIKTYGQQLKSQILLLPHHGSKTSSSYRFLLEVAPHYAIVSLGFANRFHFPHEKTLHSLNTLGVELFRTDECGMVEVSLPAQGAIKRPSCYRRL